MACQALRVGLWPGKGDNEFVNIFSKALSDAGARVVDVAMPSTVKTGTIDVLHIHWPEQIFWAGGGPLKVLARAWMTIRAIKKLKKDGTLIVWMIHNVRPHELSTSNRKIWDKFQPAISNMVDGTMTLGRYTILEVQRQVPEVEWKPHQMVWHPRYPKLSSEIDRISIREQHGIPANARVYGLFGQLRPYKGVENLFDQVSGYGKPDEYVLVAGEAKDKEYLEKLRAARNGNSRIVLIPKRLSEREFASMQAASDLIVLPLVQTLHSGSMIHALSEGRPVLTPASSFSRGLSEVVGSQWINTYESDLTIDHLRQTQIPTGAPNLDELSPRKSGAATLKFYRDLLELRAKNS